MTNKSKKILSEISAGELLDKISILEIKLDKIKNNNEQKEISKEYKLLKEVQDSNIKITEKIKNPARKGPARGPSRLVQLSYHKL